MNWNPTLYDTKHAFVAEYGRGVLEWLDPQPDEKILDIGCGTGTLTAQIAQIGARVVGIDNSPEMIDAARRSYPGIEWGIADATGFRFEEPFDAVFSNAALHWIKPPGDAVRCISQALRVGGRFVAEFGGAGNVASIEKALVEITGSPSPWYYPSVAEYSTLLERHGLEVRHALLFDRPTPLEGEDGMRNWIRMFGVSMLSRFSDPEREKLTEELETRLAPTLKKDGVWIADYRRLRVYAVKP